MVQKNQNRDEWKMPLELDLLTFLIPSFCQFPHIIWLKKMALNWRDNAQILEMESISANQFRLSYDNEFTVLAKIVQVDHGSGWCYASRSKCNNNLDVIDGSFVCSICNQECRYPIIEAFHQTLGIHLIHIYFKKKQPYADNMIPCYDSICGGVCLMCIDQTERV
ncbi:hypothetical protein LXL04_021405 [Taraxacum kok-saghyz]